MSKINRARVHAAMAELNTMNMPDNSKSHLNIFSNHVFDSDTDPKLSFEHAANVEEDTSSQTIEESTGHATSQIKSAMKRNYSTNSDYENLHLKAHTAAISVEISNLLSESTVTDPGGKSLKETNNFCNNCDSYAAMYYCIQCREDCSKFCEECSNTHRSLKVFREHKMYPLSFPMSYRGMISEAKGDRFLAASTSTVAIEVHSELNNRETRSATRANQLRENFHQDDGSVSVASSLSSNEGDGAELNLHFEKSSHNIDIPLSYNGGSSNKHSFSFQNGLYNGDNEDIDGQTYTNLILLY